MAMRGHGAARLHALSGWMSAGSATEGGDEHGGVKSALTNSRSSLANRSGGENLDAFAGYSLTEV